MGVFDAPTWVLAAWRRSLQDVGATADQHTLEAYGERMIERWSARDRIHHNLKRLIGVLARVDELAPETHHPNVVRLAAWYHGAVFNAAAQHAYARRGGVDEPASAELARTELTELGVPADVVDRIAALILDIARHSAPKGDIDAQALCDADLGALAAEPQRYAAYRKEVRAEYAHIPRADYVRARLAIVTKLLGRRYLFQSPMAQAWEDAARENLTAELDRLAVEVAALPEDTAALPENSAGDPEDTAGQAAGADPEHDGAGSPGVGASPVTEVAQPAGDGGALVSAPVTQAAAEVGTAAATPAVGAAAASAATPAVPGEVELPDGGPGPGGFVPREVDAPAERAADRVERPGGASIESAPAGGSRRPTAEDEPLGGATGGPKPETVAQHSQRRWAEHLAREAAEREAADREAADRGDDGSGLIRRRGTSATSPLEPGVGETGTNEGVEGDTEDFDETSSLSRPPRMPAVKHRPREKD